METTHRLNYILPVKDAIHMMYEDSISLPITRSPYE